MVTTKNLQMVRGATLPLLFTVKDYKGARVDLTGATAYLRVRPDAKAAPVVSLASPASGIVVAAQSGSTIGQFTATLAHSDTKSLPYGDFVWDAWVQLATGETYAVIAPSVLTILPEVTTLP